MFIRICEEEQMLYVVVFVCAMSTPTDECFFDHAEKVIYGPEATTADVCIEEAVRFVDEIRGVRFDPKQQFAVWECTYAD